jgi:hypothetical protein
MDDEKILSSEELARERVDERSSEQGTRDRTVILNVQFALRNEGLFL